MNAETWRRYIIALDGQIAHLKQQGIVRHLHPGERRILDKLLSVRLDMLDEIDRIEEDQEKKAR